MRLESVKLRLIFILIFQSPYGRFGPVPMITQYPVFLMDFLIKRISECNLNTGMLDLPPMHDSIALLHFLETGLRSGIGLNKEDHIVRVLN